MVLSTFGIAAVSTFADTAPIQIRNASSGKLTLKVGEKYKLGTTTSAGKITYRSSKPSVVSVSKKGILRAKKTGKSTIVVSVKYKKRKVKKKVSVKVVNEKKYIAGNYMSISISNIIPTVGSTAKVKYIIKPKKASNKNVRYYSSDTSVAVVDANGNVRAKKKGTAVIIVKSCANPKLKASVKIAVRDRETQNVFAKGAKND